jgi:hypothetical protein
VLAVGFHELGVGLFETRLGRQLGELPLGEVLAVSFDPANRFLAASGRRYSSQGQETPWTTLYSLDDPAWPNSPGQPALSLDGERLLSFLEGGQFLATRVRKVVRVREVPTWQVVCDFDDVSFPTNISFAAGLVSMVESRQQGAVLVVARWLPDNLRAEAARRLTRDLTADEWRNQFRDETFRPLP